MSEGEFGSGRGDETRIRVLEEQMLRGMEQTQHDLNERMTEVENSANRRMDAVEHSLDNLGTKVGEIDRKINILVATFAVIATLLAILVAIVGLG